MAAKLAAILMIVLVVGCSESKSPMERPLEPMAADPNAMTDNGWELAPQASYAASQTPGEVIIRASGENPTAGFETKLVQSPARIWPPQFRLMRKRPDGMVAQVVTAFETSTSFKASEVLREVSVFDARGANRVPVDQARD
jgi:hypothetical protein